MRQANVLLLSIGMLIQTATLLAAPPVSADKIKAAYIYQLTQFVTWPNSSSANNKVTICVLGQESITQELDPLNQSQQDEGFIRVRHLKTLRDASDCQILYIAKNKNHQLEAVFRYLQNGSHDKPILTVSSIPNFAINGGIIGFVINNNKVRLEINPARARHANIKLNAKLLEVAIIVRDNLTTDAPEEGRP